MWLERFGSETVGVSQNSSFEWNDLRPHADPSNAIVVVDKYAFGQMASVKILRSNLGPLLLSLLPEEVPDWPVHITIVTDLATAVVEKGQSVNDLYDTLSSFLKDHRSDLDIYLTLLGLSSSKHEDRYVFTNYGFSLAATRSTSSERTDPSTRTRCFSIYLYRSTKRKS